MRYTLGIRETPTDIDRYAILEPLMAFNADRGHPADPDPLAILIHDAAGRTVGGLYGRTVYQWLTVDHLVVPETLRGAGVGSRLMTSAEAVARSRGCVGSWLTTLTFQARAFYEKLGYSAFGTLDDSPAGIARIFMQKRFAS
ncbi:GNAT family N-acetyltransferase [Sphingomonas sp. RIT328]|uniref:GNAT family N-acetyltransferase n=1 Tax=Sphingomonas sp. RIT328 TaxID=1470591 RepID=UPI000451B3FD|nr:GNAT family N-acetyltransferase [Sphingomonas sp. RIT328]EZP50015.1 GCN5-like N-acetyltransferase [Sphingomonas sp. RIT328]